MRSGRTGIEHAEGVRVWAYVRARVHGRERVLLANGCPGAPACLLLAAVAVCRGDSVIMKSGVVYRSMGPPDRDNTLVYISDGLKRVVVRDSRIERIEANNAFRGGEKFQLVQPLVVHGGLMPKDVVSVEAGPWDERGRRPFRYVGSRLNKPIRMEQAIIEIGPHIVKFRGVDGFWVGVVETGQIPRDVVTSLLSRVEQKNVSRARACRPVSDGHGLERRSQERAGSTGSRLSRRPT